MEAKWLRCSVSPGQFPNEYAVSGVQFNGKSFSLFAPRNAVRPPAGEEGDGLVRVDVIDLKGELVLVRLPAQTLENGSHVTVRSAELESSPTPQAVA